MIVTQVQSERRDAVQATCRKYGLEKRQSEVAGAVEQLGLVAEEWGYLKVEYLVFILTVQISIPSISEDKLAVHLLVQAALADVVQGSEGGLLHLDLQLPQAGGGGPQVTHTQGAQGPLPQAEQQHHHEGYFQVHLEIQRQTFN